MRTPHQCPHASHQINQLALDTRIAPGAGTERGLRNGVGPADCPSFFLSALRFFRAFVLRGGERKGDWGWGKAEGRGSEGKTYRVRGIDLRRGLLVRLRGGRRLSRCQRFPIVSASSSRRAGLGKDREGDGKRERAGTTYCRLSFQRRRTSS
jgi:hypothetical protein